MDFNQQAVCPGGNCTAHTIAAVSVSGPTSNFDVNANSRLVRWAARRIASDLGADAAASTAGL